jgi:hypothetical protein
VQTGSPRLKDVFAVEQSGWKVPILSVNAVTRPPGDTGKVEKDAVNSSAPSVRPVKRVLNRDRLFPIGTPASKRFVDERVPLFLLRSSLILLESVGRFGIDPPYEFASAFDCLLT